MGIEDLNMERGKGDEEGNQRTTAKHDGISKAKSPSASDQKANDREGEELASKTAHKNCPHRQLAKRKLK